MNSDTPVIDALIPFMHEAESDAEEFQGHEAFERARQLERENADLSAEVNRLRERLEITHVWDLDGNRLPAPEGIPDGIDCRDETIRGQDKVIDDLRARLEQLEAENERLRLALDGYKKNPDECLGDGTGACVSHMAYEELRARLEQLEAENEVLREQNFAMNKTTVEQEKRLNKRDEDLRRHDAYGLGLVAGLRRAAEICDDYATREGCVTGIRAEADRLNGESK